MHPRRQNHRNAAALERKLDQELVHRDHAEILLDHQVDFNRQWIELSDARSGNLKQISKPARQIEQRRVA